jgi:hypothetical protein
MSVDLFRYHDLTERLSAFAVDGGAYLRGDREDVQVVDAEPLMRADEREVARLAGMLQLIGSRTNSESPTVATVGLVLEAAGTVVVTTQRLIVMAVRGMTQLGATGSAEVHMFAFPWDLLDSISMPVRKSFTDRVAGARTIELFSALVFMQLRLTPANQAQIGDRVERIDDDAAFRILTQAAVRHRMKVSPPEDQERLQRLLDKAYRVIEGELTAEITPDDRGSGVPSHLVGRLVAGRGARTRAASLLLLEED